MDADETPQGIEDAIRRQVRRSWWSAGVVGALIVIVGAAACGELVGLPGALLAVAAGMATTSVVMFTSAIGVGRRLSRLRGGWTASARSIERALAGQDEPLSVDQADRARRVADLAPTVATALHVPRLLVSGATVCAGAAVLLLPPHSFVLLVLGVFSAMLTTGTVLFRLQEARRQGRRGGGLESRVPAAHPDPASSPNT